VVPALVSRYAIEVIARRIAGDIVLAENTASAMRKWREIFGLTQSELAKLMGISPSVLSDYEKGRRVPGARFLKRFVEALLRADEARGWPTVRNLLSNVVPRMDAVIDMHEFWNPITVAQLVELVEGIVLNTFVDNKPIYGYTVVDSIRAIETMRGYEYWQLLGMTSERAVIFTRVSKGRSPMVAVRVSPLKPAAIVIHGPRRTVDPLALKIAELEHIPFILSLAATVDELVSKLRRAVEPRTGYVELSTSLSS